jgi:Na+-driven multidrug efflux pump
MRLSLYVMAVLGVACLMLREPLAHIFTHDAAIIGPLVPFLWMLAVAQPFMGIHFTLSGALRGSGDTMTPLLGASIGNWALRVPLAWTAAKILGWSVNWVWAALIIDHVARCTWYVLSFKSGRWAHKLRRTPIVAS